MINLDGTLAMVDAEEARAFELEQKRAQAVSSRARAAAAASASSSSRGIPSGPTPEFLMMVQPSVEEVIRSIRDTDIFGAMALPFEEKAQWFASQTSKLRLGVDAGRKLLAVRRDDLATSSAAALRMLKPRECRMTWRVRFEGEAGTDAGGLTREWFSAASHALFDPDFGLFVPTAAGRAFTINPSSAKVNPDDKELFFLTGRLIGKALLTGQVIEPRLSLPLLKHILGVPLSLADLESTDPELHRSVVTLLQSKGVGDWAMVFAVDEEVLGEVETIALKEGGEMIDVTDDNKLEYVALRLRHRLLGSIAPQLARLLAGVYQVVPERVLSALDFQELDLILSGLPEINVADWKAHTEYSGIYDGGSHRVIRWFWQLLEEEFSDEERARLLQFATGSAQVPAGGFTALTSYDGRRNLFTITKLVSPAGARALPRASTCFNRLYLPEYTSIGQMRERLGLVITMELADIGFGEA